jgi:pantothenate synthetase
MEMRKQVDKVDTVRIDYIRIVEAESFHEDKQLSAGTDYYVLIACKIGNTRLIDKQLVKVTSGKDLTI